MIISCVNFFERGIEGLYFPFSQTQGIKDQPSLPLIIDSIELNPIIDENEFKFPEN